MKTPIEDVLLDRCRAFAEHPAPQLPPPDAGAAVTAR